MNRWLVSLLLPLVSFFSVSAPLAWQAEKAGLSYTILGSIHAGKQSFYPLPSPITNAFKNSQGLIVEADIQQPFNLDLGSDYKTTQDYLSQAQSKQLIKITNELALPYDALIQAPPWMTAVTLQMGQATNAGLTPQLGIDNHFLTQAHQKKLPVYELEGMETQIQLLKSLKNDGYELLKPTIEEWEAANSEMQCLVESWFYGDTQKLESILTSSQLSDEFNEALLVKRNQEWAKILGENEFELPKGHYFAVVGALHLVGSDNVLELLTQQGFTIKPLTQGKKALCPDLFSSRS
ncbi:TraB/GumN family protein [Vibrio sp. Of7-15]|uniref:TraB/GumN family protein n=1 Tax=Vibrio sp. Of7-15 TaxID=2724879 RepID=UPI001EF245CC|nr:TraB/GumN family protein [Vibrio sp. Of7-15]MCG7495744.1 TraB/GumN family protein [Vibrio sp. Of7-15]